MTRVRFLYPHAIILARCPRLLGGGILHSAEGQSPAQRKPSAYLCLLKKGFRKPAVWGGFPAVHVSAASPTPPFTRLKTKTWRSPPPARRSAQGAGCAEAPTAALPPSAGLRLCLICAWLGRAAEAAKEPSAPLVSSRRARQGFATARRGTAPPRKHKLCLHIEEKCATINICISAYTALWKG